MQSPRRQQLIQSRKENEENEENGIFLPGSRLVVVIADAI
jgi:hypothetical protein